MHTSSMAPLESPLRRGFPLPPNGLRGSHCGAAAFEALSCGRDRVRWPCRWLALRKCMPAVEPAARGDPCLHAVRRTLPRA